MSVGPDDASQSGFAFRFEWGVEGLHALAPHCDVVVIVDVLRFTSAVSAAVEAGATVYPFRRGDDRATDHAERVGAVLAGDRAAGPSLSPTDLLGLVAGTRLVLPSPNGSTIAATASEVGVANVLAGSLRNAAATARRARLLAGEDGTVGVVGAGERWHDGRLRPAVEDVLGAGAVLRALDPSGAIGGPGCSPEAAAARAAFLDARTGLGDAIARSTSGRELVRSGSGDDVATAATLDATDIAAQLTDGAFAAAWPI